MPSISARQERPAAMVYNCPMRSLVLLLVPFLLVGAGPGGKVPVTTTDLLKIRSVSSLDVAPNGAFAVYGVRSIHTEAAKTPGDDPEYSYRNHLWYIDLTRPGSKPVRLTNCDRLDSQPAISPDGRQLAFVRADDSKKENAHSQVWLMPLDGPGEPRKITELENGASSPVWRPDGKAILVASGIPLSKMEGKPHFALDRPGRDWFDFDRPDPNRKQQKIETRPDGDRSAIRNWLARNASKDAPAVITRLSFLAEQGLEPEMEFAELYLIDLENGNRATQLTRDYYSHGGAAFSPDGKQIVYVSKPVSKEHPDRVLQSVIWMMNADGTSARVIVQDEKYSFFGPHFLKGGKELAVSLVERDYPGFRQSMLARVGTDGTGLKILTGDWASATGEGVPTSDGRLLFASEWQGAIPLLGVGVDGGVVTRLTGGPVGAEEFDEGGGRIVVSLTSVAHLNELYVIEKDGALRQLTNLNGDWLREKAISAPEEHWITRPDGTRVQYWTMKPFGAQPGRKYPTVLEMHGGPMAMWGPGEFSMWHEFQLLSAWGYGIVYANPRGSGGYGFAFQRANYQNWGDGPTGDVLGALDDAMKNNNWIDGARLFLTGGSYAGYLTAWIVGHDNRFKAAVAQRGVYDLKTFYGEGNAYSLVKWAFGGYPWEPETARILERESPYTYVDRIITPLLIMHGSEDLRTGYSQSEMLYRSLKQMGRPVEYIRYPKVGHELSRSGPPQLRMDRLLRTIEFFERYADNQAPAPVSNQQPKAVGAGR